MTAQGPITAGIETGGGTWRFPANRPLALDSGAQLAPLEIGYKTYGALNEARTNAVLVCHAVSGDHHLATTPPVTGKPGWWDRFVGPGRPLDPERNFIICTNVVGGCMGSTGPASRKPDGTYWGTDLPVITMAEPSSPPLRCSMPFATFAIQS